ncbi:MAG: hypothetical protein V4683_02495, partial [Bacteroidota bacterium]
MKNKLKISLIAVISVLVVAKAFSQNSSKVELAMEQFNQFVNVRDFCLSINNDEIYFTVQSPSQEISQIAYMQKRNGKWSAPQLLPFSDQYSDLEPFLSPDQTKLYFASNRPLDDSSSPKKDHDIWYVTRQSQKDDWSKPINIGTPINSENNEFYPSVSVNNNLYFTSDATTATSKDDIYFSKYENGSYQKPMPLDSNINSNGYEFNAFVSAKEDFLIFTKYNSEGGVGSGDLYLSTKDKEGNWLPAKNLGTTINTKFMEYCPFYDEAHETLYFTSRRSSLEARKFKDLSDFNQYVSGKENGLSKIYKIKIKIG